MKRSPLLGALPIIAKMLGRQIGVRVVIGASHAYTDGRTIFLPALPADSASLAVLAHGYIDHEAAHLRYTDFTVEKPSGLAGEILSVLEDVRIERELGAAYLGSRANLAALMASLEAQETLLPPDTASITEQVMAALLCLPRAQVLGQAALAPAAATLEARLHATLPPGVVIKLLALAFEVRHTRSTAEVKALALRIVAMLQEEAARPPDPPSPPGAAPGSETVTSDASGSSVPSGDPSDQGTVAGDPSADPSGSSAPSGDPSSAASGSGDPSRALPNAAANAGTGSNAARQAALRTLLASDGAGAPDVGTRAQALLNARTAREQTQTVALAEYDPPPPNVQPTEAVARARAATAALRRRLGALVQAEREEASWCSRRGRRLDTNGLYRLALRDPTLFRQRARRDAPDTAVGLLLDRSGSMGRVIDWAGQAVLATTLALEAIPGVACWAAAFPGRDEDRVIPLKAFTERAGRVAGRFAVGADGGTPLAEALWRAGYALASRPEPRRLLIVATDGRPNDVASARDIIARCRASGIEVMGLGIGQNLVEVQAVFGVQDAVAIARIDALAPALFQVLERRLTPAA